MSRLVRRGGGIALLGLMIPLLPTLGVASSAATDATPSLLGRAESGATVDAPVARHAVRDRVASLALDVDALATGDALEFNLFPDATVRGTVTDAARVNGAVTRSGDLSGGGDFTIASVDGVSRGTVTTPTAIFEIVSDGEATRVSEVTMPSDELDTDALVPPGPAARGKVGTAGADAAADGANQIDVLVAYTPQAQAKLGGASQTQAAIASAVAQTNRALTNSQVPAQVRVVGTAMTAQNQGTTENDRELDRVTDAGDGWYEEIQALRETTHADQVSLLLADTTDACGIGWLYNGRSEYAYTTVDVSCLGGKTFGHELGHNLGAHHDPAAGGAPHTPPYAYGYVYVPGNWRTMMSYTNGCSAPTTCTRIDHFSNPAVAYNGVPTGTATANNARAITDNLAGAANFRQSQITAGTVSIDSSARFGRPVTAVSGGWLPASTVLGYQWLIDGQPIPGATGATFVPPREYLGHGLSVVVTGSAATYNPVGAQSGTVVVGKGWISASKPKIKGKAKVGRKLKVKIKASASGSKVKKKITWYRNGKKIKGAKGKTYRVKRKDRGKKISVKVKLKAADHDSRTVKSKKKKVRR